MVIVAATMVTVSTVNINIAVDIYVGVFIDVGVAVDVSVIIDVGISVDISAAINVGTRSTLYLPGLCILGQHPAGSDDKTPDSDQGYKPGE